MTKTLLIVGWMILLTGCKSTVVMVSEDRYVRHVAKGQEFVAPCDGWFVPQARMYEILNALEKQRIRDAH